MAKLETYYWVDPSSNFGGGESPIQAGDSMPDGFEKDPRFEGFKKDGKISTEKVASKRVLSELEQVKAENAELKKGGKSSGITQAQLDTAKGESVQADLDRIALLEGGDRAALQDKLDLVKLAIDEITLPMKKEKLDELKNLFAVGE